MAPTVRWRRAGRRDRGSVLVEYATVLALITALALVAFADLGDAGTHLLQRQAECVATGAPEPCVDVGTTS